MKILAACLAIVFFASTTAISADFPKGSPGFEQKLADALAKAKETNKPVIAVFSAGLSGHAGKLQEFIHCHTAKSQLLKTPADLSKMMLQIGFRGSLRGCAPA